MSASTTLSSYADCEELFERALQSKSGTWIKAEDNGAAMQLKTRLNYCRKLLRDQSREIYEPGDAEYGVSAYDSLTVSVRGNTVYLKKQKTLELPSGEIEAAE